MVITARLTEKGKSMIDSFPDWSHVKHVQGKPVVSFLDGEWLILQKAEKDNHLEVAIDLPHDVLNEAIMSRLEESYLSNGSTSEEKLWDEQRKEVLKEVIIDILMPIIISEIRVLLTTKAKSWIQSKCSDNLWKTISMAPYRPPICNPSSSLEAENSSKVARVLACCWGSRNPPTTFVMVDSFGRKIDILQTGYLNLPSSSGQQQLQRKMDDQHRLQKFILKYKPQVIIVGASTNMGCRFLKDTVKEVL
jgi:transcription elongation factor SPT6